MKKHKSPPCPNCQSPLTYDEELKKYVCNHCGYYDGVENPEEEYFDYF